MASIAIAAATDGVFNRLVAGLETEFGTRAAEGLARHFVEAEAADFYWDARSRERWLGSYECLDDDTDAVLDRVPDAEPWLRHRMRPLSYRVRRLRRIF